jgi:hypothetical protein
VPASQHRAQEETVERVKTMLVETLSGVSQKSRHAIDLLRFYASERERLDVAEQVIGGSTDQVRRILREAEALLLTQPETLTDVRGRVPLLHAWADVLLDATDRIEREDRWGDAYAAERDDDDAFAAASAIEAGTTWPSS